MTLAQSKHEVITKLSSSYNEIIMKLSQVVYNLFCHRVVHATNGPAQLVIDSSLFESLLTQTNDLS